MRLLVRLKPPWSIGLEKKLLDLKALVLVLGDEEMGEFIDIIFDMLSVMSLEPIGWSIGLDRLHSLHLKAMELLNRSSKLLSSDELTELEAMLALASLELVAALLVLGALEFGPSSVSDGCFGSAESHLESLFLRLDMELDELVVAALLMPFWAVDMESLKHLRQMRCRLQSRLVRRLMLLASEQ